MGLFDGYDRSLGSAAQIAEILDIPVLIVVGARSTAYSVAAQLVGIKNFRPGLKIAGVVFNQVSSGRHRLLLEQAAADAGLRCFGYIPRTAGLEVPSRHLGLSLSAAPQMEEWICAAAGCVEANVDIEALLDACRADFAQPAAVSQPPAGKLRIAVARDAAFNFTYVANMDALFRLGSVRCFSPLAGDALPEADLLYLPGGYPELYAVQLSVNQSLMEEIRAYVESGGKVLAECGGMIYLTRCISGVEGGPYKMCGVLPLEATMEGARLHLGYRRVVLPSGVQWRGHEFHYSEIVEDGQALPSAAEQFDARGVKVATPLYRYKNIIAGYTHLYWGESDIMELWK